MLLWLLVACAPSSISLGDRDSAGRGADPLLLGDTAMERAPGDTSGAVEPDPVDDPDLYENAVIWELSLTIEREGWDELSRDGSDYVDATLAWDAREWPVAIHIKGSSSWQPIEDKPSLVIDVDQTVPDQEFLGAKKFYLHNDCYDPSQMSETLSYAFYREWQFPASRTSFAHLTVNSRDYGLYTVVEPHNHDFLQDWFAEPDGNLYENREAYCDVTDVSCMEVEQDLEGDDAALARLGDTARARGPAWRPAIEPLLDWERFLDALALEITLVHWDSYSYDLSNYQLYHEPVADHWTLLTQSMDLDYGFRPWSYPSCGQYGMDIDNYTMGMLAASCHGDSTCKEALVARVLEFADRLEAADGAARVRDLDALIGDAVRADPRRYYDEVEYADHIACLEQFFAERPAQLRAWAGG